MSDRSYFRLFFIVLLLSAGLSGQQWDVTLSSGQTYSNVRINGAQANTLLLKVDFYEISLPFHVIEKLNYHSQIGLHLWGFLGGVAGGYAGYLVGKVFGEKVFEMPLKPREDPVVLFPTATGAVLGTVFGADFARRTGRATDNSEYDLSTMTPEQKIKVIDQILNDRDQPFFLTLASYLY